jgi:hypothetical protein
VDEVDVVDVVEVATGSQVHQVHPVHRISPTASACPPAHLRFIAQNPKFRIVALTMRCSHSDSRF